MREEVFNAFLPYSSRIEGNLNSMYTDIFGLVHTGIGNLIDPFPLALILPWKHGEGGQRASAEEVKNAWDRVKNSARTAGMNPWKQAALTDLRITKDEVNAFVRAQAENYERSLKKYFPHWDELPSDAILAILSMAWALGPDFPAKFPAFKEAINRFDFEKAAIESYIVDNEEKSMAFPPKLNPGLRIRNIANQKMLLNAQSVHQSGGPIDRLVFDVSDFLKRGKASLGEATIVVKRAVKTHPWMTAAGVFSLTGIFGVAWYLYRKGH